MSKLIAIETKNEKIYQLLIDDDKDAPKENHILSSLSKPDTPSSFHNPKIMFSIDKETFEQNYQIIDIDQLKHKINYKITFLEDNIQFDKKRLKNLQAEVAATIRGNGRIIKTHQQKLQEINNLQSK